MTVDSIEAIRKRITVAASRERAFEAFTTQMGRWWNRGHHIGAEPFADVVVEPRTGGGWYEVDDAGTECRWGEVLVWEPPGRVVLNWQISPQWAYAGDQVTELEITFTALSDDETLVELEHRRLEQMGGGAAAVRAQLDDPSGWQGVLVGFGAALAGGLGLGVGRAVH